MRMAARRSDVVPMSSLADKWTPMATTQCGRPRGRHVRLERIDRMTGVDGRELSPPGAVAERSPATPLGSGALGEAASFVSDGQALPAGMRCQ